MRFKAEAGCLPELFCRSCFGGGRVYVCEGRASQLGNRARASAWQRYAGRTERERGGLEAG